MNPVVLGELAIVVFTVVFWVRYAATWGQPRPVRRLLMLYLLPCAVFGAAVIGVTWGATGRMPPLWWP